MPFFFGFSDERVFAPEEQPVCSRVVYLFCMAPEEPPIAPRIFIAKKNNFFFANAQVAPREPVLQLYHYFYKQVAPPEQYGPKVFFNLDY